MRKGWMIRRISSIKVKLKEKGMTCVFSSTAGRAAEQRKQSAKKGGKGKSKGGNRLSRQEKSKRVKKQKIKS